MSSETDWNTENDLTAKVRMLVGKAVEKIMYSDNENTRNALMDPEFRKNILKGVRQRLEEEKSNYSAMQDEVQEIADMVNAFQKRTNHVIEDLKFVKMLIREAHDRLTDESETSKQKVPSPLQSPKILGELSSGFQK